MTTGFAVRKDGLGYRAVADESDCTEDENWQTDAPQLDAQVPTEQPAPVDWVQKLKAFVEANPDVAAGLSAS